MTGVQGLQLRQGSSFIFTKYSGPDSIGALTPPSSRTFFRPSSSVRQLTSKWYLRPPAEKKTVGEPFDLQIEQVVLVRPWMQSSLDMVHRSGQIHVNVHLPTAVSHGLTRTSDEINKVCFLESSSTGCRLVTASRRIRRATRNNATAGLAQPTNSSLSYLRLL